MPKPFRQKSLSLAEIADLEILRQQEESLDRQTRRAALRSIAGRIPPEALEAPACLRFYIEEKTSEPKSSPGRRLAAFVEVCQLTLAIAGFLLGAIAAAGLFHYTGDTPVSINHLLGVFVILPLLLLLLFLLAAVAGKMGQRIPGVRAVADTLTLLSPGRLLFLLQNLLPEKKRDGAQAGMARVRTLSRIYGSLRFWLFARATQIFAIAFHVGAILTALWVVTFSDVVFAWGTTLEIQPETYHAILHTLARPWGSLFPSAVPSIELVALSRYFQLGGAFGGWQEGLGDPVFLGSWWSFVLLAMTVYGLLPRLALYALAEVRLRAARKRFPQQNPALRDLADSLRGAHLQSTGGPNPEEQPPRGGSDSPVAAWPAGGPTCMILWDLPEDAESALQEYACPAIQRAGGLDMQQDERLLQALCASPPEGTVVIAVQSAEPPTRDFSHFLADLRAALKEETPLRVLPLAFSAGSAHPPAPEDLAHWKRKIEAQDDPDIAVLDAGKEAP